MSLEECWIAAFHWYSLLDNLHPFLNSIQFGIWWLNKILEVKIFVFRFYIAAVHCTRSSGLRKICGQNSVNKIKKNQVKQPRCGISFVNPFHFVFIEDSWRPAMKILLCSTAFDAGGRQTDTRIHNEKPKPSVCKFYFKYF